MRLGRITIALGFCSIACTRPEPEPAAVGEAAPAVSAPELEPEPSVEQVEYVDPLDAARAAARAEDPGDASWREGFDHRAPTDPDGPEPSGVDSPTDGQSARNAPVEDRKPAAPPADATPTFSEPLPALDGAEPPEPGGARHPDDAQPPPR